MDSLETECGNDNNRLYNDLREMVSQNSYMGFRMSLIGGHIQVVRLYLNLSKQ